MHASSMWHVVSCGNEISQQVFNDKAFFSTRYNKTQETMR